MAIDIGSLFVYRIIPIQNLEDDLKNGLICKAKAKVNPHRIPIGNREIIEARDRRRVDGFPGTCVNDCVPFYFSTRTPMLYNIITGKGVPRRPQEDIIYLCFRLIDLATEDFQWCFTDGNAAVRLSKFYNSLSQLDQIDWRSIHSTDFSANNADGDGDRIRKKHAEFLVKERVPIEKLSHIAVLNERVKKQVETILAKNRLNIKVVVKRKFYFL
jgi:hypothetical protein